MGQIAHPGQGLDTFSGSNELRLPLDGASEARFYIHKIYSPFKMSVILLDENGALTKYRRIIEGDQINNYRPV